MVSARTRSTTRRLPGLLITFEGTEGSGKSTLIREVEAQLKARPDFAHGIVLTREPGGSPIAEKIRKVILDEAVAPLAELFLYEAARAEHMARTIVPALERGDLVLCDRFTDSALAYQGNARGLSWKQVSELNDIATGGLHPHLTFLLDIDPATGLSRARELTRFEAEGVEFQIRVRKGFLKAMREDPKRWKRLKVEGRTPAELGAQVIREISRKFPKFISEKRT